MSGTVRGDDGHRRCGWGSGDADYRSYHDDEWGRPVVDDTRLYEKLCLEGFQSGLSWLTILRKRDNFRRAFAGFDPEQVARFGDRDVARLLADAGIVRHRGKIEATINNARATLEAQDRYGSLAALVWSFEPPRRGQGVADELGQLPAKTPESIALSKALLGSGFKFVGPTTMYAAMQSLGLVNDHLRGCWVRGACTHERGALDVPVGRLADGGDGVGAERSRSGGGSRVAKPPVGRLADGGDGVGAERSRSGGGSRVAKPPVGRLADQRAEKVGP